MVSCNAQQTMSWCDLTVRKCHLIMLENFRVMLENNRMFHIAEKYEQNVPKGKSLKDILAFNALIYFCFQILCM